MDNTTEFCLTAADGGVNQFEADASDEKEMVIPVQGSMFFNLCYN